MKTENVRVEEDSMREAIRPYLSKLPLSTPEDTVKLEVVKNETAVSVNYTYGGPSYSTERGYVVFKIFVGPSELYLEDLFVNKNFRNKGYGRQIMDGLEDMARELGFSEIVVEKSTNNPFLSKMGYAEMPSTGVLASYHKKL